MRVAMTVATAARVEETGAATGEVAVEEETEGGGKIFGPFGQ